MTNPMAGELTADECRHLLRIEVLGRLGCHSRGRTYVVPLTYGYDGTSIICHTGNGLKISMMRENPQVCFEVDRMQDAASWQSVIAQGAYEELHDTEADEALTLLLSRLNTGTDPAPTHGPGHFLPASSGGIPRADVMFRIRVAEMSGRFQGLRVPPPQLDAAPSAVPHRSDVGPPAPAARW